jgi:hypothetical protein
MRCARGCERKHPVTDPNPKTSRAATSTEAPPLRNILGGALFYIGIPAATLYPLGFLALSLQLWRDPNFPYNWATSGLDFPMIWYAASMVPKVVVIGMGVRLLVLTLISTVLGMCIGSAILLWLQRWKLTKGWAAGDGQAVNTADFISQWERRNKWERRFWYLSLVILLPLVILWLWNEFPVDGRYDLPFLGGYVAFSALGGVALGYIRFWGHDRWKHHGLVLAFVGSIIAGLCLSSLELPRDLPYVELDASESWPEDLPNADHFRLLNSDPNNLYVYNRESGILSISSHSSSQTAQSITRYWDQPKRPPVDTASDEDGRVNDDSDANQ